MQESLEELMQQSVDISTPNFNNEKRKKEYLVSRLLLKDIAPNTRIIYKYGAPGLENGKHISISHSKNLVAIIFSKQKVGLDIETISEKPLRLSSKFISKDVHQNLTEEKATLIWCVKEAIFKWHQKGNVDFKNDIKLKEFEIMEKGEISCNFKGEKIIVKYRKIDNQYLAYVCR